jgi:hypothetical protein
MIEMKLVSFERHAVALAIDAQIAGDDAGRVHDEVAAERLALDAAIRAERDAVVSALPEARELARLQSQLESARAKAGEQSAKLADLEGKWTQAIVSGQAAPSKLLASREAARTAAAQSREIVSALEGAVADAEQALERAATRAAIAWRDSALKAAQEAERQALEPVEQAIVANAAKVIAAKVRFDQLRVMSRGQWRDAPEHVTPPNKWQLQSRKGIEGRLATPPEGSLLTPSNVTMEQVQ